MSTTFPPTFRWDSLLHDQQLPQDVSSSDSSDMTSPTIENSYLFSQTGRCCPKIHVVVLIPLKSGWANLAEGQRSTLDLSKLKNPVFCSPSLFSFNLTQSFDFSFLTPLLESKKRSSEVQLQKLQLRSSSEKITCVNLNSSIGVQLSSSGAFQTVTNGDLSFPELQGDYLALEKIGEGTFSSVFLARSLRDNHHGAVRKDELVALKRIYPTCHPSRMINEISFLKTLGGKFHVAKLLGALRYRDHITLVLPYFPHEKFKDILQDLQLPTIQLYMKCLFESLAHVHDMKVIHRDVKPGNFLFNLKNKTFMLVDFGLAQKQDEIEVCVNDHLQDSEKITSPPTSCSGPSSIKRSRDSYSKTPKRCKAESSPPLLIAANIDPSLPSVSTTTNTNTNTNTTTTTTASTTTTTTSTAPVIFDSDSGKKRTMQAARAGTRGFRAPEVLMKYRNQTTAVDIWSAGVIFLSLLTKRYPFFHSPDDLTSLCEIAAIFGTDAIQQVATSLGKSIQFPSKVPSTDLQYLCQKLNGNQLKVPLVAFDLLRKTLDLNPFTRISAKEALSHPFFANL